jgi:hypothetical protein
MRTTTRLLRLDGPSILHWDGHALHGLATSKAVVVTVPARFVSFRIEELPPAAEPALKSAARLKADRAFAPLGAVAIEALLPGAHHGRCTALMMALPKSTIETIRAVALTQGHTISAIRVAELSVAVPIGGMVTVAGDACLLAIEQVHGQAHIRGIAALGPVAAAHFKATLTRERLRLGIAEDAPAAPALGNALDFIHPTLTAPPKLLARPAVRLSLLAAGVVLVVSIALGLSISATMNAQIEATALAERLRPLAASLAARRADLKEVATWIDQRPSLAPGLLVLGNALPDGRSDDRVRLVRVRQTVGEDTVVEGTADDRAQMMSFLTRLRRDQHVSYAEIRSSRSPSKEATTVVFELVLRLGSTSPPEKTEKIEKTKVSPGNSLDPNLSAPQAPKEATSLHKSLPIEWNRQQGARHAQA